MKKTVKIFIALAFVISVFCICTFSTFAYQIFVELETGEKLPLEAEGTDTVSSVKSQIEAQKGIPVEHQNIVYLGKILDDAQTLSELNISDQTMLSFVVRNKLNLSAIDSVANKDVVLSYTAATVSYDTLYSFDVLWDDMSFTYGGTTSIWNPGSHKYDIQSGTLEWRDNKGKIVVNNHSNAALEVLMTFEQASTPNGSATIKLDNPSFRLENADGNTNPDLLTANCNMTAEGTVTSNASVGKITVSISVSTHIHNWIDGVCSDCNEVCKHNLVDGICSVCGYNSLYEREDSIIYFGEYPQTLKADSVTVEATADERGYFLGSDNAYYAKVIASPYEAGYKFTSDATVTSGVEYYFKVEPLKWRIVSESDGNALLVCESIIDSSRYDDADNNYKDSEIREWLNNNFYNKAFSDLEQKLIQTVTVDNSISSTGYYENANVCENTSDKIYLLSYADAANASYGFASDGDRMKIASDFARAKGAWISTSGISGYYGNGMWMLRSPNDSYSHFIRECNYNGEITDGGTNLTSTFYGIVPMLKVKL